MQRVANQQFLYRRGSALYFRRGIPEAARHAFEGKREVVISLGTTSLAEARHKLALLLRDFDQKLSQVTQRPDPTAVAPITAKATTTLSRQEVEAGVQQWFFEQLDIQAAKDFGRESPQAYSKLIENEQYETLLLAGLRPGPARLGRQLQTEWIADHIIDLNGWNVETTDGIYSYLLTCIARGELELGRRIHAELNFEPLEPRDALFLAEPARPAPQAPSAPQPPLVYIMDLFEGYISEAACKPATVKAWRTCLANLIAFLKHDNAALVTPLDLVNWKEHLSAPKADGTRRSPRTIRDKYLACTKSLFKWAAENHRIQANPAANINQRVRLKARLREEKGLNDAEACAILSASLKFNEEARFNLQAFARRWVPWLCAYTGARVGEITQLRGEDIVVSQGLACIRITPEAGTQKSDKARIVPLHPHLLEQGFLAAIAGRTGPLFYDPANYRGGSEGNPQSKKVAERLAKWVRQLGVDDPEVQPNHGWRHRFKTQARLVGMSPVT